MTSARDGPASDGQVQGVMCKTQGVLDSSIRLRLTRSRVRGGEQQHRRIGMPRRVNCVRVEYASGSQVPLPRVLVDEESFAQGDSGIYSS